MKLKEYIENLRNFVKENPEALEMTVVYSEDGDLRHYKLGNTSPVIGSFCDKDPNGNSFTTKDSVEKYFQGRPDYKINSVCIN